MNPDPINPTKTPRASKTVPAWAADVLADLDGLAVSEPLRPAARHGRQGRPPILTTGQRQGDVFVQPDPGAVPTGRRERRRLDRAAVVLADGQEVVIVPDGNRHLLVACTADG